MSLFTLLGRRRDVMWCRIGRTFSRHTLKASIKREESTASSPKDRTFGEERYESKGGTSGEDKAVHPESPVCSYNEWDPLEEVIVGRLEGAAVPLLEPLTRHWCHDKELELLSQFGGRPYPNIEHAKKAQAELDEFCNILRHEGVVVKRPEPVDFTEIYRTPDFKSSGFQVACPRDLLLVVGNEIIEAPMALRSRFFEYRAYRPLLKDYFKRGAMWTAAPKPQMVADLYENANPNEMLDTEERLALFAEGTFPTSEFEPCFDAADFTRAGRDIFVQRSMVTNYLGIEWMRRHLGDKHTLHVLSFDDPFPHHIDATFCLIKPGLVLSNPDRPCHQADFFIKAGWKLVPAPSPAVTSEFLMFSSKWLAMNVLMLDPQRVMVEKKEVALQKLFNTLGIECIPVDFQHAYMYDGGLHCYTCDVRRRGTLESYF